jgi:uncharacterized membrane protein
MDLLHWLGGTVCHQAAVRSLGDGMLCTALCSRCTGVYSGILLVLLWHTLTVRALPRRLPPPAVLLLVALAAIAVISDVILTTLALAPAIPWVRVLTGTLSGSALALVCLPVFSAQLLPPRDVPRLTLRAALGIFAAGALLTVLLLWVTRFPAGIVAVSGITVAAMLATLAFIIAALVQAVGTALSPRFPLRAALLLTPLLLLALMLAMHALVDARAG